MADNPVSRARPTALPTDAQVDSFLKKMGALPSGRLIFGLDATASREPTWDTACQLQREMFREAMAIGGLEVQLVYYRGRECKHHPHWFRQGESEALARTMARIICEGGYTQIEKVLVHGRRETQVLKVSALVFIGDACEENPDALIGAAGELGRLGVPAFMFQEGLNEKVEHVFREIARVTRGAYSRFDEGSAAQLAELLKAVAIFASGGRVALEKQGSGAATLLLQQLK
jgi:hypothetical protein